MILYKAIPIPTEIERKLIVIIPTVNYFLLNTNRREIIPISNEEINNCRRTLKNELICAPSSSTIINKDQSCELSLILDPNQEKIQRLCEFRQIPERNYFIQMDHNNRYYCIIKTPILITEHCSNTPISTTPITMNGILELKPGCSIVTNDIKISSFKTITSKPEILLPLFHISKLKEKIIEITGNVTHLFNQNYSIVTLHEYNNEFIDLSEKITYNLQKAQAMTQLEGTLDEKVTEMWTTICTIIFILILVYIIYKKFL